MFYGSTNNLHMSPAGLIPVSGYPHRQVPVAQPENPGFQPEFRGRQRIYPYGAERTVGAQQVRLTCHQLKSYSLDSFSFCETG